MIVHHWHYISIGIIGMIHRFASTSGVRFAATEGRGMDSLQLQVMIMMLTVMMITIIIMIILVLIVTLLAGGC